jgi:hypothetical protein
MCSIEEAWAGQDFLGKPVSSQSDIRKAYMSLPQDNIHTRNNEFSVSNPNEPQSRELTRGINSKYSREPRVPNKSINNTNASINFSSTMPKGNSYTGVEPRPAYMSIYDNAEPQPVVQKDHFSDIDNAFNVSNTVDNFMQSGMNMSSDSTNSMNPNALLKEDTIDDEMMMNNKIMNRNKNKNEFMNIKKTNKYDSSDSHSDDLSVSLPVSSDTQLLFILQQMMSKLDKIESDLHYNNSRNMYDITLYILIGMLISFIFYSIYVAMSRK